MFVIGNSVRASTHYGGGSVSPLTTIDLAALPSFLPDGRHFTYIEPGGGEGVGLYVGALDNKVVHT